MVFSFLLKMMYRVLVEKVDKSPEEFFKSAAKRGIPAERMAIEDGITSNCLS